MFKYSNNFFHFKHPAKTRFLEIRFPKWCKYPSVPPLILLRNKISDIPKSICLRINQRLIDESRELAKDQIPSAYSVVDLLKNEEEILRYLNKAESYSSYPSSDVSIFDYDPNGESSAENEESENLPTHFQMGKTNKFNRKELSEAEIQRENLNIVRRFQEKQQSPNYLKMIEARKSLPTWPVREEIVDIINSNQVVIISGETGSGKSTQIPQFILDDWLSKAGKGGKVDNVDIVVTQPRR